MNTEHLFGLYWAKLRRLRRDRSDEPMPDKADPPPAADARTAARDEAYQRLFEAIRDAVRETRERP